MSDCGVKQILKVNNIKNINIIYIYILISFLFSGLCYKLIVINIDITVLYFVLCIEKIIICMYLYKYLYKYNQFIIALAEKCVNIFNITENTFNDIKIE